VCLNKFPKPPNFIGVFFVFSIGNLFDIEGIGVHLFEWGKNRKKSLRKHVTDKLLYEKTNFSDKYHSVGQQNKTAGSTSRLFSYHRKLFLI